MSKTDTGNVERQPETAPPFEGLFARAYTRYWRDHAVGLLDRFSQLDARFQITNNVDPSSLRLLDVACGEGTFAVGMAKRGWHVTGIDLSKDMLDLAEDRLRSERRRSQSQIDATFICDDMREIALPEKYLVATCWFNSVNYLLTEDDVERTFRGIRRSLVPGGVFLFDLYTPHGLSVDWETRAWVSVDEEDCFIVADTKWIPNEQLASVHFIGFIEIDGHYRRFDERHFNRGYHWSDIANILQQAGFNRVESVAYPSMRNPTETTVRLLCVARVGV